MIQKIYEADPLICPKCHGPMRIISFIEDAEVIKAILDHLGLWAIRFRPPAKAHTPPSCHHAAMGMGQPIDVNAPSGDPDYPWEAYITS